MHLLNKVNDSETEKVQTEPFPPEGTCQSTLGREWSDVESPERIRAADGNYDSDTGEQPRMKSGQGLRVARKGWSVQQKQGRWLHGKGWGER